MVYRIYPVLLFTSSIALMFAGFAILGACEFSVWSLFWVPIPAAIAGYLATCAVVSQFPKLRFVNEAEIDGLGYVHQPLGTLLLACLIGLGTVVVQLLR
jgi:hypothetical protein